MSKDNRYDRRRILKSTGGTVGALGITSQAAAARGARDNSSKGEMSECEQCARIIEETKEYQISIVTNEGGAHLLKSNKETHSVTLLDQAQTADQLDTDKRVSILSSHIIESVDWDSYRMGNCNGYIYNNHRAGVLAIKTGQNLNGVPETALSAAICGIAGVPVSGPVAVLFGIGCAVGWQIFFGHIDLVDAHVSMGMWDDHVGWLGEEAVMTGASNSVTTNHSNLASGRHAKGVHLGVVDDTQDRIDKIASLL